MLFVVNVAFNFEAAMAEFLLPVVAKALGVPIEQSQTILYLYYVAIIFTLAISLTSKSPMLTRVPGFVLGTALFACGSLFLALTMGAGIVPVLIARLLQGAGVALIVSATPALIVHWRLAESTTMSPFVLIPISIGVGILAGPSIGAFAAENNGLSFVLITVAVVALAGLAVLPFVSDADLGDELPPMVPLQKWDYNGLLAVGLGLWSILILAQAFRSDIPISFALPFALGLLLAVYLLIARSDSNSDHPVINLQFVARETNIFKALVMSTLSFAATYVIAYVLPFYIYYNILSAGTELKLGGTIVFVPLGFVLGPIVFERVFRANLTMSLWASVTIYVAALGFFGWAEIADAPLWLLPAGAALGVMRGIFVAPFNQLTIGSVPTYRIDETSAYCSIARYIGMALGILAGSGLVLTISNLGTALLAALGIGLCFIIISAALIRSVSAIEEKYV